MPPAKRSRGLLDDYPAARPYVEPLAQALFGQGPVLNLLGVEPTGPSAWQMVQSHDPQAMQELAAGFAGTVTPAKGIRAFHGSPHDFDKFSLSKIGTGEGAQAYGHGLYFAENEGVAKSYKTALSGDPKVQGRALDWTNPRELAAVETYSAGSRDAAIANLEKEVAYMSGTKGGGGQQAEAARAALEILKRGEELPALDSPGKMYEVEIKADPESLLDWDAPLSQQPEKVREALGPFRERMKERVIKDASSWGKPSKAEMEDYARQADAIVDKMTGREVYERMAIWEGKGSGMNNAGASTALREAGVPGLKYFDQGSRAGGQGSRNIVSFDDSLVEILRKYGLAGLTSAGGLLGAKEYVDRKGLLDG
jgi:hypothetical protein